MKLSPRLKEIISLVGICIISTTISVLLVRYFSFVSDVDKKSNDIRLAALQAPMAQDNNIVIISINEQTLEQFPYRSPIDREFLAKLLITLDKKGVRLIGLDLLFDQPTEEAKDDYLKKVLREIKTPVFASYTNLTNVLNEDQQKYLDDFVPPDLRASANMGVDPFDGTVRWIYPGEQTPTEPKSFVRRAAEILQIETPKNFMEIAWRPNPDEDTPPFKVYPAQTVAFLQPAWLKDKVVFIGAVLSITDRHQTPLQIVSRKGEDGLIPGVFIHAHGLSQIMDGRPEPIFPGHLSILIALAAAILGVGIGLLKKGFLFNIGVGFVLIVGWWALAFLNFKRGFPMVPLVGPSISIAFAIWMMDILIGKAERNKRKYVQGAFSRYLSPDVVKQLVDNPEALNISGVKKEATFIFTDIAGFTGLLEKLTSEQISVVLNEYLDGACQIILRHKGTIDKFIGDAIMCMFNAPLDQADHADRAVQCALDLDQFAEQFRIKHNAEGVPIGVTRIGVHTGQATIGNFGSASRMDFTALGDTVNTASRTEGVNKYFGTRICVTQSTVDRCSKHFFRKVGIVVLKGKEESVGLYNPVSEQETKEDLYRDYSRIYNMIHEQNSAVIVELQKMVEKYPQDPLFRFHLQRIEGSGITSYITMDDK
jgi:class 3 adenylate cyclase/CHASE2 domain-containing sensor protein